LERTDELVGVDPAKEDGPGIGPAVVEVEGVGFATNVPLVGHLVHDVGVLDGRPLADAEAEAQNTSSPDRLLHVRHLQRLECGAANGEMVRYVVPGSRAAVQIDDLEPVWLDHLVGRTLGGVVGVGARHAVEILQVPVRAEVCVVA